MNSNYRYLIELLARKEIITCTKRNNYLREQKDFFS